MNYDPPPGAIRLILHMEGTATQEEMNANVTATLARGYVRLNDYLGRYSGTVSICGSGPSLESTLHELHDDILAINGAIGVLLAHDFIPKWAMIWDASPLCEAFAIPHPDVTYLIGARCHESVFRRLQGCKVIVWHAGGDHNIMELMKERQITDAIVNGGSAGVTRALYLAFALGYRDLHVFGADSCYSDDGKTHATGASVVPEKSMSVFLGGKNFRTTPEWCAQVEEIKMIYPNFRALGAPITAHGTGMLPWACHLMSEESQPLEATQ